METVVSMHAVYPSGGGEVTAYLSRPSPYRSWPALVLIHEWWGLDQNSRDLSRRLAKEGFAVLVPDLYDGRLTDDRQQAATFKVTLDCDRAARHILDAAVFLKTLPYVRADAVGVLGFCLGGGLALLALARGDAFRCGVIYYQSLYPDEAELAGVKCPILCHYGTADPDTPPSEIERFEQALRAGGVSYTIELYEGAGHAFFNSRLRTDQEAHNAVAGRYDPARNRAAAEASWEKTLTFLRQHLGEGSAG